MEIKDTTQNVISQRRGNDFIDNNDFELMQKIMQPIRFIHGKQKILFVNNQDSFVYNLVNYICQCSESKVRVVPNTISIKEITKFNPDKIFISPGPGHPKYDTGNVLEIIRKFAPDTPIMGVCLGHQAICEAYGENKDEEYVGLAKVGPMHGKISKIFHNNEDLYRGLPNPCEVVRYHSLAAKADQFPRSLKITSMSDDGTIMGLRHRVYEVHGVQFHPESIMMRPFGMRMISNFLSINMD